ncbi:NAD(P)H-flavin reductase [Thalassotalea fusca]
MSVVNCQVKSIEKLTAFVYKILLSPDVKVDFLPGQYLNFIMSDEDKRPFSIASAPQSDLIELQIGAFGEDSYAMQVIDKIKSSDTVQVEMAFGLAQLREDSDRPLLLVAGGTGFSYIKSIFEHLVNTQSQRPVTVYWGLREPQACYEIDKTTKTIGLLSSGSFHPVVEFPDEQWHGKTGMVHQVVMADIDDLSPYDIYLAGRFDMIGAVRDDFVEKGADVDRMFADAFAYI